MYSVSLFSCIKTSVLILIVGCLTLIIVVTINHFSLCSQIGPVISLLFIPFLPFFFFASLRCGSKQGEEDYRPLFENFVQDLLSTVNKPEWPAAELLLSLLGRLLVSMTKIFL